MPMSHRWYLLLATCLAFLAGVQPANAIGEAAGPPKRHDGLPFDSARLSAAEQLVALKRGAELYQRRGDYRKAVEWASRYFREGGRDLEMRTLLTNAHYLGHDYADAARGLQAEVQAAERSGHPPPEERMQWLLDCYEKLNDNIGAIWALEKLVIHYPKKTYWAALLVRLQKRLGSGHRLALDVMRLRFVTGTLATAEDHVQMVALALQAGFPAEAKKVLEQGYTARLLGVGTDADRHKSLRDLVLKHYAEDQKRLAQSESEAAAVKAEDGLALVNLGLAYLTHGSHAKGISLMEQGIRIGVLSTPQDAKLHLAIAYLMTGQRTKAIDLLRTVTGRGGAADLARLWEWHARQS